METTQMGFWVEGLGYRVYGLVGLGLSVWG